MKCIWYTVESSGCFLTPQLAWCETAAMKHERTLLPCSGGLEAVRFIIPNRCSMLFEENEINSVQPNFLASLRKSCMTCVTKHG